MSSSNPDGGSVVVGDDTYFDINVEGILGGDGVPADTINPCGSDDSCYLGGLFEIVVPLNAPYGIYNGTATLDATDANNNPITGPDTVLNFQVDVIPEPGMGVLMFAGLASLAAMGLRVRQASRPVVLTDVPAYSGKQTGFRKTQNHPVTVLIYDEP
jgi:hypothetical protein